MQLPSMAKAWTYCLRLHLRNNPVLQITTAWAQKHQNAIILIVQ
tara:strand:+ start:719 stop:850 length:132 start_codon:yes stop_codon:yes gene_type:complete